MTAKTRGELLAELRDRLDEPEPGYWTNVELRRYLNEALRRSARKTFALKIENTVNTVGGTATATAPSNMIEVIQAAWVASGSSLKYPLEVTSRVAADGRWGTNQTISSGTPDILVATGVAPSITLRMWPIPSSNGVLHLYYAKFPALLSTTNTDDTTTVDWPEGWEDMLVDYAEWRALLKRGDVTGATTAEASWQSNVEELATVAENYSAQPSTIERDNYWWVNGPM